jgi:hypothetical protein
MAWIFFESSNLPSLETINPSIILENINAHLFGLELRCEDKKHSSILSIFSATCWKPNIKIWRF